MDARILVLALLTGGSEAALILIASQTSVSDVAWGVAAGFCLTIAGTLAAAILGLSHQAWGRRAALGATVALLAQGLASALAASWAPQPQGSPTWLYLVAPLLGALGGLLGSFIEGAIPDRPASEPGRQMRRGA
jgi:MFS family permease